MRIESSAFEPAGMIPPEHTCDGKDVSPPLAWTDPPESTASFALICDDPDAPSRTWVHWLVWNIPPAERRLAQGIPKSAELPGGARQGTNDFRRLGYGGPCPPSGTHRYFFRLFALDATLNLSAGATREELERAMSGHLLGQAELMGKYRRS
jgi:Raf kinase inhibitor-like YbhB/YbcL family protein